MEIMVYIEFKYVAPASTPIIANHSVNSKLIHVSGLKLWNQTIFNVVVSIHMYT